MRLILIRISTNYYLYLKQFYAKHPELATQPYQVQYQTLMEDCFGWADFWSHALKKLGYEVWEPVSNAENMQKKWAKENGIEYQESNWFANILTAQIQSFQPEVIFVDDCMSFETSFISYLKQKCKSVKLILGWCGAPYKNISIFCNYDIILSNIKNLVNIFREQEIQAEYFRHAFESRILDKINIKNYPNIDFYFIGSIYKRKSAHLQREQLLVALV